MKYRKLRIAWSVGCGILCLLLIVLWVRSYWWVDFAAYPLTLPRMFMLESTRGTISLIARDVKPGPPGSIDTMARIEHHRLQGNAANVETAMWGYSADRFGMDATFPHWLPVFVAASFAAIPCVQWSRRFSLRALLMGMTVVAVALGLVIWTTK